MELVNTNAIIRCGHDGKVANVPRQTWVRVAGAPVLVEDDPQGRRISACPNIGPTMKPCTRTLRVATGYSAWLKVDGHQIIMSNLDGLTDGTVPGTVHYTVRDPGQSFVRTDR